MNNTIKNTIIYFEMWNIFDYFFIYNSNNILFLASWIFIACSLFVFSLLMVFVFLKKNMIAYHNFSTELRIIKNHLLIPTKKILEKLLQTNINEKTVNEISDELNILEEYWLQKIDNQIITLNKYVKNKKLKKVIFLNKKVKKEISQLKNKLTQLNLKLQTIKQNNQNINNPWNNLQQDFLLLKNFYLENLNSYNFYNNLISEYLEKILNYFTLYKEQVIIVNQEKNNDLLNKIKEEINNLKIILFTIPTVQHCLKNVFPLLIEKINNYFLIASKYSISLKSNDLENKKNELLSLHEEINKFLQKQEFANALEYFLTVINKFKILENNITNEINYYEMLVKNYFNLEQNIEKITKSATEIIKIFEEYSKHILFFENTKNKITSLKNSLNKLTQKTKNINSSLSSKILNSPINTFYSEIQSMQVIFDELSESFIFLNLLFSKIKDKNDLKQEIKLLSEKLAEISFENDLHKNEIENEIKSLNIELKNLHFKFNANRIDENYFDALLIFKKHISKIINSINDNRIEVQKIENLFLNAQAFKLKRQDSLKLNKIENKLKNNEHSLVKKDLLNLYKKYNSNLYKKYKSYFNL